MSRESSGESLEAILASIRRSLAEQATDVLEEEPSAEGVPPADMLGDADTPPVPGSLAQQLNAARDAFQSSPASLNGDTSASLTAEAPPAQAEIAIPSPQPAAAATPAMAAAPVVVLAPAVVPAAEAAAAARATASETAAEGGREQKDPLWFLGDTPGQRPGGAAQKTGEPEPSRMGVVRGPLPPFFGSSAESVKVEMTPDPPALAGVGALLPPVPEPPLAPPPPVSLQPGDAPRHTGIGVAGDGLSSPEGWPRAGDGTMNGKASAIFGPTPAEARPGGAEAAPQMQAFEMMVAELLRPMLRRWLDENMPRLVSAALKAEAEGMSRRDSGRDSKKP